MHLSERLGYWQSTCAASGLKKPREEMTQLQVDARMETSGFVQLLTMTDKAKLLTDDTKYAQ